MSETKAPGASRMAARILANLRAYAANPCLTFAACWKCSPLPSHLLSEPCALCREDRDAEAMRAPVAAVTEKPIGEDPVGLLPAREW